MPSGFSIPDQLLYSAPAQTIDGDINQVQFQPVSGETFTPGQSITLKISSENEFLVPQRSYLQFDLKLTGGAANTAPSVISSLGGASVLRRVTTTVSGV